MVEQEILGFTAEGEPVILYTITNSSESKVKLINIGAAIVSISIMDNNNQFRDVIAGYRTFDDYLRDSIGLGKTIGRYAGRIANGKFALNDNQYRLPINNGRNHFNGGTFGLQTKVWGSRVEGDEVVFSYQSPEGDEGYPGSLGVEVTYSWNDNNQLLISHIGIPTADTIANLTSNAFFNLNGESSGDIINHVLTLNANKFLPVDRNMIPTGEILDVIKELDFTSAKEIGKDIEKNCDQLYFANGYDHNWVINNWESGIMSKNAELYSSESGIVLSVFSTHPSVNIYSGNNLYGAGISKCGKEHDNRQAIAIICQNFPDAPNNPHFPTSTLKADEIYDEQIMFSFSIK